MRAPLLEAIGLAARIRIANIRLPAEMAAELIEVIDETATLLDCVQVTPMGPRAA